MMLCVVTIIISEKRRPSPARRLFNTAQIFTKCGISTAGHAGHLSLARLATYGYRTRSISDLGSALGASRHRLLIRASAVSVPFWVVFRCRGGSGTLLAEVADEGHVGHPRGVVL